MAASFAGYLEVLDRWEAAGATGAVATVVAARGSTPRPVGSRFLVSSAGDVFGSVSGGCVESDVARHAHEVLAAGAPRLVTYGIAADAAFDVGLACGGSIDVFIEPAGERADLRAFLAAGATGAMVTVVSGPDIGARALCGPDGALVGGLLPAGLLDEIVPEVARLVPVEGRAVVAAGDRAVFVESLGPAPLLVVVGATDIGAALTAVAREAGYRVVVVDPREAFAVAERFPAAERVVRAWPETVIGDFGIDERTHVVVLSHDERIEGPLLPLLLASPARYLGVMGSRRTHAARLERLRAAGWGDDALARLRGPVGLDLGGGSRGEIAVAIVAEMTLARRRPGTLYGREVAGPAG